MMVRDLENNNQFGKRLVGLLISQRERMLASGKNPEKKGFKSVEEILGLETFINYSKKKYENGKRMSA
jgi:hypothetical protein